MGDKTSIEPDTHGSKPAPLPKIHNRKLLLLAVAGFLLILAVWVVWGFDWGKSDEAKYQRMRHTERLENRLLRVRQWFPMRYQNVSPFLALDKSLYERYHALRKELLASGYMTNATFRIKGSLDLNKVRVAQGIGTNGYIMEASELVYSNTDNTLRVFCRQQDMEKIRRAIESGVDD
jgi:hypothetical protein